MYACMYAPRTCVGVSRPRTLHSASAVDSCLCLNMSCAVLCAAGEFGQEQLLLGRSYQVHECKAALQHLHSSNIFGAALSSVLSALLGVR